jgi:PAS domain-containing protein
MGMAITDLAGRLLHVNNAAATLLGAGRDELLDGEYHELAPSTRRGARTPVPASTRTGAPTAPT